MESGRIQLQDLFGFDRTHGFRGCGVLPGFAQEWADSGVSLETAWFSDAAGRAPDFGSFTQGLP
jgi:pilus assembly protein CpaF